ncbi:hypothetical protein AJ78_05277 [Emergomyces pasteurianus Ep9510]|uniref:Yeast cell wall synthesis Kre9/Knh1-like N-terminal domain-containing protein n=1 Tax=Emergomyces pasteurianus Ep9510 TaxID=1447872 RepID=A0A1J9QEK3_9EURO|nr:hypothetical protein AJ78_05277 [Emergomyces pasteurianus Ep9510]
MFSLLPLVALLLALASTPASGFSFSKRADTSRIIFPQSGDGITTGTDLDIRWESASSEASVSVELRKGQAHNLTTVHTISNNTPNNGSFYWRSRDDNFLRALTARVLPNAPSSGCDYAIAIREGESYIYSGYFTILNLNDDGDGLDPNIRCPGNPPSKNLGGGGGGGGTGSQNGTVGPKTNDVNGVTMAMLGGAVGGAAVGLLVIFATVLLFGRQKNWFVNEGEIQRLVEQRVLDFKPALLSVQPPPETHFSGPYEFSGEPYAHQLPVTPAEK